MTPNGFIAAHDNDPRVLYSEHDTQFRELAKVDGGVQSLMTFGHDRFAALGRSGELIRGSIGGGPLERIHVDVDANAFLGLDRDDHVIVAVGATCSCGTRRCTRSSICRARLRRSYAVPSGLVASSTTTRPSSSPREPKPVVHDLLGAAQSAPIVGGEGTWLAAPGNGGTLAIVELPSLARWELPPQPRWRAELLAARRRRSAGSSWASAWASSSTTSPDAKGDLAAWLDDRTNAYENPDGFVSWPWLRP